MLRSSINAEHGQAFFEKVSQLAEANGLPSKGYSSSQSEFSFDKWRNQLNKVRQFEKWPWTNFLSYQELHYYAFGLSSPPIEVLLYHFFMLLEVVLRKRSRKPFHL